MPADGHRPFRFSFVDLVQPLLDQVHFYAPDQVQAVCLQSAWKPEVPDQVQALELDQVQTLELDQVQSGKKIRFFCYICKSYTYKTKPTWALFTHTTSEESIT